MIGRRPHRRIGPARRALVLLIAALALLVTSALPASACSCAMGTVKDHVGRADLIARATVTAIDRAAVGSSSGDPVVYVLSTFKVWKGPTDAVLHVQAAASGESCGLEGIAVGDELIVFATVSSAEMGKVVAPWSANLCGGTAAATPALADEVAVALGVAGSTVGPTPSAAPVVPSTPVGTPTPVATTDPPAPAASGFGAYAVPIAVGGALIASGLAAWLIGRRRP